MPPPDTVKNVVLELWIEYERDGAYASHAVAHAFKRHPQAGVRARDAIVNTF